MSGKSEGGKRKPYDVDKKIRVLVGELCMLEVKAGKKEAFNVVGMIRWTALAKHRFWSILQILASAGNYAVAPFKKVSPSIRWRRKRPDRQP